MSDQAPAVGPSNLTSSQSSPQRRDVCAPRSNPNRHWACGYAELGKCCASGPTSRGRCGLTVAATDSSAAAADEADLVPCIPRRTAQWRRQSLPLNLAILTGGILLLCMTLPTRETTFVPGELSSKHAQILDNTLVSQRCGLCHPNSHSTNLLSENATSLLGGPARESAVSQLGHSEVDEPRSTLDFFTARDGRQDALCMQCHQGHMPRALERSPHDLSAAVLQSLAHREQSPAWQLVNDPQPESHHAQLAATNCADCHVEHHGRGFDLKAMADDRCQACHRRKFESLTSGHPEFQNFPVERPRSLAFSHRLHADKHFPQKNSDFDCRKCHLDHGRSGSSGPIARSVSFETACAQCHQQPIKAAMAEGWAVLQLPSIDAAAAASGSPFEHWPNGARFGFDGTVSPVLHVLLQADDAARAALASLPASGQIADVPSLGDQREQVGKAVALATERLIRETARDGQAAWQQRLLKVTQARAGRELNANERALIEAMCAGLPPDLFRQMQSAWLDRNPIVASSSSPVPAAARIAETAPPATSSSSSLSPQTLFPLAPPATPRDWLPHSQGIIIERNTNGLLVSQASRASDERLLNDEQSSPKDPAGDLLLSDALLDDAPDDLATGDALATGDDALLNDEPLSGAADEALLGGSEPQGEHAPAAEAKIEPLNGAMHLAGGGWYIDRETLALRYMATGHADKTLAAWSMWWTRFNESGAAHASRPPHAQNLPQPIPGGCVQCHETGRLNEPGLRADESLAAAWRAPLRPFGTKEFTKFDHAPHLSLPAVNDCRYCHVLRDESTQAPPDKAHAYPRLVSVLQAAHEHRLGSEFRAMQLSQCVACHRPSGANAGCLHCHNYHISSPQENGDANYVGASTDSQNAVGSGLR